MITLSAFHDATVSSIPKAVANARILVVEDNDLLRSIYEDVLTTAGYGTQGAGDGVEALALLAISDFDVVITDGNMPNLNGCDLVRAIRARGNPIPIIMISGLLANGGTLPADVSREVSVAMAKPVHTTDVLAGIEYALRPQKELQRYHHLEKAA